MYQCCLMTQSLTLLCDEWAACQGRRDVSMLPLVTQSLTLLCDEWAACQGRRNVSMLPHDTESDATPGFVRIMKNILTRWVPC